MQRKFRITTHFNNIL